MATSMPLNYGIGKTYDQTCHGSLQTRQLDLQHLQQLVNLIQNIFRDAAAVFKDGDEQKKLICMMKKLKNLDGMRQAWDDIQTISLEMSCSLSATGSVDETRTAVLFRRLNKYSRNNDKMVLALAAFAFMIGHLYLKQSNSGQGQGQAAEMEDLFRGPSPRLNFTMLQECGLFTAIVDVVKTLGCLELEPAISRISKDQSVNDTVTDQLFHIVVKITTILNKMEDGTIENTLIYIVEKIKGIDNILKLQLCEKEAATIGNKKGVKLLHYTVTPSEVINKMKDSMKIQVPEALKNKHVLLLISDLDISIEEIEVLNWLYQNQKNDQMYEILWVPIVEISSTFDTKRFRMLKQLMNWKVFESEPEEIEYIKKELNFTKNTIAVSVNARGEVICKNALPMLWTWGNLAFPFTDDREQELLNKVDLQCGWKLDLLLDEHMVPDIRSWIGSETTFVCLFGGGDESWIQEFTTKVKSATSAAGVTLKLVYVGKTKGKLGLPRNKISGEIIVLESESRWKFWTKLESILQAKIRLTSQTKEFSSCKIDRVMQEATKVVGYGGNNGEAWTIFSMGAGAMVTTSGKTGLTIISDYYEKWRQDAVRDRFLVGLERYKEAVIPRDVHGRINIHLSLQGQFPGIMTCPECSKVMEMFYTYRCCAAD